MASIQMISPTVQIYSGYDEDQIAHTVYGWYVPAPDSRVPIEPIVANPDGFGPGIGRWSTYYGEDPWWAAT